MKRIGITVAKRLWILTILVLVSNITTVSAFFSADGPTIDVWYENDYDFGAVGTPQTWINILGNISDPDGIDANSLEFDLNNGAYVARFKIGPDDRRLANAGDFNIDIETSNPNLIVGTNSLSISAEDNLGNLTTKSITFEYTDVNSWPLPYIIDWDTVTNIQAVSQVVDGLWAIENGGVRPTYLDYDRVIAVGDLDWTDYTITVPITIHELDDSPDAVVLPSLQPSVGFITHWLGHDGVFGQPKWGFSQLGMVGWVTWHHNDLTNDYLQFYDPNQGGQVGINAPFDITFGETYIFKMQMDSQSGPPVTYRLKVWHEDDPEPSTWAKEEEGYEFAPGNGSLLLTAHHVDATFGRVIVQTNANSANPTLTVSESGNGSTTLSQAGPYASDEVVDVTATPDVGWVFSHWTGDASGSDNPLSVTLDANKSITAVFTEIIPEVTTTTTGSGAINRSADAPYSYNQNLTLTAVPDAGWEFIEWTEDASGPTNPISLTLTSNITVTAVFTEIVPVLTTNITGNGAINRSADAPYSYNQAVNLTAVPDAGWEFVEWSGDASGSTNPLSLTLTDDVSVTAIFQAIVPELTTNVTGNGSVNRSADAPYSYNQVLDLTAVPNAGWEFVEWSGDASGSTNPLSLTLTTDTSVTAVFTEIIPALTTSTTGSGAINRSADAPYSYNQSVNLTAVPDTGWEFVEWAADASGSTNPLSLTLTTDISVTAVFTEIIPVLTTTTSGDGTVNRSADAPYSYNQSVDLTAVPDAGWEFVEWTGDVSGSTNPISVNLTDDMTVTAVFSAIVPELTTSTSGNGSINPSANAPYSYNQSVNLTAVPDAGWEFVEWTGDASSSDNPLSLTLTENVSVTAIFTEIIPTLSTATSGNGSVSRSANGPYTYNQQVTVTATPDPDWLFSHWSGDVTSMDNPLSLTLNGDISVTAVFVEEPPQPVTLTTNTSGDGTVTRSVDAPYVEGMDVTLTAVPDTGWQFSHWSGDVDSTDNPITLTLNADTEVTAVFSPILVTVTTTITGDGNIDVSQSATYQYGQQITITATPDAGWKFTRWGGDLTTTQNPLTITLHSDMTIEAIFEVDPSSSTGDPFVLFLPIVTK
ncbi:MAG: hypothetical protein AAF490_30720 [Chloroflexota bacterium]